MEVMFSVKCSNDLDLSTDNIFYKILAWFFYIKLPKGLSFIAFHSLICIRNVDTVEMVFLKTISLKLLCW